MSNLFSRAESWAPLSPKPVFIITAKPGLHFLAQAHPDAAGEILVLGQCRGLVCRAKGTALQAANTGEG